MLAAIGGGLEWLVLQDLLDCSIGTVYQLLGRGRK